MCKDIKTTIERIRKARKELQEAVFNEKFVSQPLLSDYSILPDIYSIFCNVIGEKANTVNGRKIFTFVCLYLYAPRKLFGGKMPKGLRTAICRITNIKAATAISNNSTELLIFYHNYPDFRNDVETVYQEVVAQLHFCSICDNKFIVTK